MTSTELHEKMKKIRRKNEEIRKRYEEVEADRRRAAKLDALEERPSRKEPPTRRESPPRRESPELSASSSKYPNRSKQTTRKSRDSGPPPDPVWCFLADTQRDDPGAPILTNLEGNWGGRGKSVRGSRKTRENGDWHEKEHGEYKTRMDYEAWKAERKRIDEARINRQRTAEGNWRREWDNDKANDNSRRDRVTLGDVAIRQDHWDDGKLYRPSRVASKIQDPCETIASPSVMRVKVSPPNIAGTGRVGPRQRPRLSYSNNSEVEASSGEARTFAKPRSTIEKPLIRSPDQTPKASRSKNPRRQRKCDVDSKSLDYPKPNNRGSDKNNENQRSINEDPQTSSKSSKPVDASRIDSPKSSRFDGRSSSMLKNDSTNFSRISRNSDENKFNENSVAAIIERKNDDGEPLSVLDEEKTCQSLETHESLRKNRENSETKKFTLEEKNSPIVILKSNEESCSQEAAKNSGEALEKCLEDSSTRVEKFFVIDEISMNRFTNETEEQEQLGDSRSSKESTDDVDDAAESDQQVAIDRSADSSALAGNDSGFVELTINESPKNVSGNCDDETSDFCETSVDSDQSTTDIHENQAIVEDLGMEKSISDAIGAEVFGDSSFGDFENKTSDSSTNIDHENASEIFQDSLIDPTDSSSPREPNKNDDNDRTTILNENENNSRIMIKMKNDANEFSQHLENHVAMSSNVRETCENDLKVENNDDNVDGMKIVEKLEKKDVEVEIVVEECENNSSKLESDETNSETMRMEDETGNAEKMGDRSNESAIDSKASNVICKKIVDEAGDEKIGGKLE